MQCPPSPLLFDPSVALDQSLRDIAEAPIDILALEEPSHPGLPPQTAPTDRGSSSAHVFPLAAEPSAELPAQVTAGRTCRGLQVVAPLLLWANHSPPGLWRMCPPWGIALPCSRLWPCYAHGLDGIRSSEGVAAGACPQGSGRGWAVASSLWVARCHPLPVCGMGVAGAVWDMAGMSCRLGTTRCRKPIFSHLGILRGSLVFCFLLLSLIFHLQLAPLVPLPGACGLCRVLSLEMSLDALLHPLPPLQCCPCSRVVPAAPFPLW